MKFEDFLKKGQIKRASKDIQLIKSIISSSDNDLKFLSGLKIDEVSSRKIFSNYYDVLRSILEALALLDGYKVYSHEAFKYFLDEMGEEVLSIKFDRFRKLRNKVNYYGKSLSVEEVNEYKKELIELIKKFKEKIKLD